jgi:small-conductance mechanosensitive channel
MIFKLVAIAFLLFANVFTLNASESTHTHSKHKPTQTKSTNVATSPEYSNKNHSPAAHTIQEGIDGEVNEIILQRFSSMLPYKNMQNFFNTERVIGLSSLIARLMIILAIFSVAWKAINRFTVKIVSSIISKTKKSDKYFDAQAIANTAGPILNSVLHWFIITITLLIILSEIGVDIMPIIYSFGVFSLAISIGAQTLVKDVISGILTLFEGIVAVGEIVELNGNIGNIESMSLRAIELRHSSGKLQIISFSEINSLINLSRDYSICKISIPVAHEADINSVETIFTNVYECMKNNPIWSDKIKSGIKFSGVDSITETAVYVEASIRTAPDPSDEIGNEFRKQLHMQMNIAKIPYPKYLNTVKS